MPDDPGPSDERSKESIKTTSLVERLKKVFVKDMADEPVTLKDALSDIINDSEHDDAPVHANEVALFNNLVNLRDLSVSDIKIPRADVVAVDIDTPFDKLMKTFQDEAHSRLPVYRETLDDVLGMVHVKDLISYLMKGEKPAIQDVLREVIFASPSMRALDLLLEMQDRRMHLALIIDEHGGIDGLVTIEDLVEQIVGNIDDEHDIEDEPFLIERADNIILADARTPIEEFEDRYGRILDDEDREEIETLGGLVFDIAGRVPGRGEVLVHPEGFEFEVVDGDTRRVKRLRIRRVGSVDSVDAVGSVGSGIKNKVSDT